MLPLHFDCDPGQDDAIALLYALGSKNLCIQAISTVGGNAYVENCTRNALQMLELAQRSDIPVFTGAEKPLKRKLVTLPEVFGITGMAGGEDLPDPQQKAGKLDRIDVEKTDGFLVATGPLTNLALNIQKDPKFVGKIKHLFIMGGCVYPEPLHKKMGNIKPEGSDDYAEYNFACDPEAAQIVFSAGIENITLVGLDVTRSVLYGMDIDGRLRAAGNKCSVRAADILSTVGEEDVHDYADVRKSENDPVRAMHDVVAMACVENPRLFKFETLPLKIITASAPAAAGQSLIERDRPDHPAVRVAVSVDTKGFVESMIENISRLP